jgi:hypothetical protein
MMLVIDEGGGEAIYLHKGLWVDDLQQLNRVVSGVGLSEFTRSTG